jgi:molecular chaperone GrpE
MSDSGQKVREADIPGFEGDDGDIEIVEVVGLEEDSPGAEPVEADSDEIVLDLDATDSAEPDASAPDADDEQVARLRAEFENMQRRVEREQHHFRSQANAGLIARLLPVLDNFERALAVGGNGMNGEALRDGIILIFRQLLDELRKEGLEAIDAVGEPFDPEVHEAVETEAESAMPPDTVTEELQRGYRLNSRLLRPSLVKVRVDPSGRRED